MEGASCTVPAAHTTGYATLHSLLTDVDNLSLNPLFIQSFRHFTQSSKRITVISWASVN